MSRNNTNYIIYHALKLSKSCYYATTITMKFYHVMILSAYCFPCLSLITFRFQVVTLLAGVIMQ